MNDLESNLAGAIYNLSCTRSSYGKVNFVVKYFKIARSTLYRKMSEFKKNCVLTQDDR